MTVRNVKFPVLVRVKDMQPGEQAWIKASDVIFLDADAEGLSEVHIKAEATIQTERPKHLKTRYQKFLQTGRPPLDNMHDVHIMRTEKGYDVDFEFSAIKNVRTAPVFPGNGSYGTTIKAGSVSIREPRRNKQAASREAITT